MVRLAWLGAAQRGKAGLSKARQARLGLARLSGASPGIGKAQRGKAGTARLGTA